METYGPEFFITGGTLPPDALSYVERGADQDLLAALQQGEFTHVLTSRQMGKSSLMVRTAVRLREAGVRVAVLDLTAVGQNLTPVQWYRGLLMLLAQQLGLEAEVEHCWRSLEELGAVQRWTEVLCRAVLINDERPLVLFIDEIEAVRNLPFPADEFFAAIRECYNRRVQSPVLYRLAFCLLGVVTPSDLIRDTRSTPFNISRRVEVNDFTLQEASILSVGIALGGAGVPPLRAEEAQRLLERVYYWTGGQPYLTQRLCQAVAAERGADPGTVDRLCRELFLRPNAEHRDDNLAFVRDRLVRPIVRDQLLSSAEVAALLQFYLRVRRGSRVRDDQTDQNPGLLRLSGVVRSENGLLKVRNRIYEQVFDPAWVAEHFPHTEARLQRTAYRRGLLRAVSGCSILMLTGIFGVAALERDGYARKLQKLEQRSRYVANLQLAQRALERGNFASVVSLLDAERPSVGEEDLRGFEWRRLWALTHCQLATLGHQTVTASEIRGPFGDGSFAVLEPHGVVTFFKLRGMQSLPMVQVHPAGNLWGLPTASSDPVISSDGRLLAQAYAPSIGRNSPESGWRIAVLDRVTGRKRLLPVAKGLVVRLAISRAANRVAAVVLAGAGLLKEIHLWRLTDGKPGGVLRFRSHTIPCLAFAPAGKLLATGDAAFGLQLWQPGRSNLPVAQFPLAGRPMDLSFSEDGHTLAMLTEVGEHERPRRVLHLVPRLSPKAKVRISDAPEKAQTLALSRDGERIAVGTSDGLVLVRKSASGEEIARFCAHSGGVSSIAFLNSADRLITAGEDHLTKLWSCEELQERTLTAHSDGIASLSFSEDGKTALTAGFDGRLKTWNPATWEMRADLEGDPDGIATLYGNGDRVALVREGQLRLQDGGALVKPGPTGGPNRVTALASSGHFLAVAFTDSSIRLWDGRGEREIARFGDDGELSALALSRDGRRAIVRGRRGGVSIWDTEGNQVLAHFNASTVGPVALSDDGSTAAWAEGRIAVLYDLQSHRVTHLSGHLEDIGALAFSPDGRTMVSGSREGYLVLWSVLAAQQVGSLPAADTWTRCLAFSPDGEVLAAGTLDGSVQIWRCGFDSSSSNTPVDGN